MKQMIQKALMLLLVFACLFGISGCGKLKAEPINQEKLKLGHLIPELDNNYGEIVENTTDSLVIKYDSDIYEKSYFTSDCRNMGYLYGPELEKSFGHPASHTVFDAYRKDGCHVIVEKNNVFLGTSYYTISLEQGSGNFMSEQDWPEYWHTYKLLIPQPESTQGRIFYTDRHYSPYTNLLRVYVGDTTRQDYEEYVKQCVIMNSEEFDEEAYEQWRREQTNSISGEDTEGNIIEITYYPDDEIMLIQIEFTLKSKPSPSPTEESSPSASPTQTPVSKKNKSES